MGTAVSQAGYVITLGSDGIQNVNPLVTSGYIFITVMIVNFFRINASGASASTY